MKVKTIRSKLKLVVTEYITVPIEVMKSNKNITISGDILFVNKIILFATVNHNINFTTIKRIKNRTMKHLINSMRNNK